MLKNITSGMGSGFEILLFAIYTVLLEGLFSRVVYASERRLTHQEK